MPSNDTITFIDYHKPFLSDGDYEISIKLITNASSDNSDNNWPDSLLFSVVGTRFRLKPEQFYNTYPPLYGVGNYTGVLPSITFTNSSLPWERKPDNREEIRPWLAIISLPQNLTQYVNVQEMQIGTFLSQTGQSAEFTDVLTDTISILNIPPTYQYLIPTQNELSFTAFVKNGISTETGTNEATSISVVLGKSIPFLGKNVSYLVSLENVYANNFLNPNNHILLPILYSWEYEQVESGHDATMLLNHLNIHPSTLQLPPLAYEGPDNTNPNHWLNYGYVLLPHYFRNGQNAASWYKTPLSNAKIHQTLPLPAMNADALLIFNPDLGTLDATYAAAYTLGRQLALQSNEFSSTLYKWKKKMSLLAQFQRQLANSGSDATLPVLAQVNRWNILNANQLFFYRLSRYEGAWRNLGENDVTLNYVGIVSQPPILLNHTFGSSVYLSGRGEFLSVQNSFPIQNKSFSLSIWAKLSIKTSQSEEYGLLSFMINNNNQYLYVGLKQDKLILRDNNHLLATYDIPTNICEQWQHVVCSLDNSANQWYIILFLNGEKVITLPWQYGNLQYLMGITIGRYYNYDTKSFLGCLANFRLYACALKKSDIALIEVADKSGKPLHTFFNDWAMLKGIPFQYLVPDERMLPTESIRFFQIDPQWVEAFTDGAFSLGRISEAELQADTALLQKLQLNSLQNLCGVIIRSAAIGQLKSLKIKGYHDKITLNPDTMLPIIRLEALSDDTLIAIFQGDLQAIQIYTPAVALHYGLGVLNTNTTDTFTKDLRYLQPGVEFEGFSTQITVNNHNQIDFSGLAYQIGEVLNTQLSPSTLAFELVEVTELIEVTRR